MAQPAPVSGTLATLAASMMSSARIPPLRSSLVALGAALAAVVAISLLLAAPASADTNEIIRDCADDGRIDGSYTTQELQRARRELPADVREYTDCSDALRSAINRNAPRSNGGGGGGGGGFDGGGFGGGSGGGGGVGIETFADTPGFSSGAGGATPTYGDLYDSGGLAPPSDVEQAAADQAARDGGGPVDVGGNPITPGSTGLNLGNLSNSLPQPLLIALIVLGACALLGVAVTVGGRVLGRRSA